VNKRALSESDICAKWITPALTQAGWNDALQIRREVSFTKGRIPLQDYGRSRFLSHPSPSNTASSPRSMN
jgi:type I site-specific restriction endonuclease